MIKQEVCWNVPDGGPEGGSANARQRRHSHSENIYIYIIYIYIKLDIKVIYIWNGIRISISGLKMKQWYLY